MPVRTACHAGLPRPLFDPLPHILLGEGGGNLRSLYVRLVERHAPADIKVHGVAELNHRFRAPLLLHDPQGHSSLVVGIGLAACTLAPDAALLHSVYGNAAQVIVIQPFHLHIALILRVEHARKPFQIIDEPFQSLHVGEIILKFMSMLHKLLRGEQDQAVPVFSLQIIHLLFQQILYLVSKPGIPGKRLHHLTQCFHMDNLLIPAFFEASFIQIIHHKSQVTGKILPDILHFPGEHSNVIRNLPLFLF